MLPSGAIGPTRLDISSAMIIAAFGGVGLDVEQSRPGRC